VCGLVYSIILRTASFNHHLQELSLSLAFSSNVTKGYHLFFARIWAVALCLETANEVDGPTIAYFCMQTQRHAEL